MVILQAGVLDESTALHVFRHAFVDQKSACTVIADGLPQYADQPPPPDPSEILF